MGCGPACVVTADEMIAVRCGQPEAFAINRGVVPPLLNFRTEPIDGIRAVGGEGKIALCLCDKHIAGGLRRIAVRIVHRRSAHFLDILSDGQVNIAAIIISHPAVVPQEGTTHIHRPRFVSIRAGTDVVIHPAVVRIYPQRSRFADVHNAPGAFVAANASGIHHQRTKHINHTVRIHRVAAVDNAAAISVISLVGSICHQHIFLIFPVAIPGCQMVRDVQLHALGNHNFLVSRCDMDIMAVQAQMNAVKGNRPGFRQLHIFCQTVIAGFRNLLQRCNILPEYPFAVGRIVAAGGIAAQNVNMFVRLDSPYPTLIRVNLGHILQKIAAEITRVTGKGIIRKICAVQIRGNGTVPVNGGTGSRHPNHSAFLQVIWKNAHIRGFLVCLIHIVGISLHGVSRHLDKAGYPHAEVVIVSAEIDTAAFGFCPVIHNHTVVDTQNRRRAFRCAIQCHTAAVNSLVAGNIAVIQIHRSIGVNENCAALLPIIRTGLAAVNDTSGEGGEVFHIGRFRVLQMVNTILIPVAILDALGCAVTDVQRRWGHRSTVDRNGVPVQINVVSIQAQVRASEIQVIF